jgi:hypothetical protein
MKNTKEDTHFLIDSAPPTEVLFALQSLEIDYAYSTKQLRERLLSHWGYTAQKNLTFSTRRLIDLGLAAKSRTDQGKPGYILTKLGSKVLGVISIEPPLYSEITHYLHYTSYNDQDPTSRKLFWSYRACSDFVWEQKHIPSVSDLVKHVQEGIEKGWPEAYARRDGGNFNKGGVTSGWKPWIAQLTPSVIADESNSIIPRDSTRYELVALALDDLYRHRHYRYGDPVVIDEVLLDEISRVFFLDPVCCRELLDLAARLISDIKLADTFAGTSVTLMAPYTIERI